MRVARGSSERERDPVGAFVALDFETADSGRDSACSVALVRVEGERVVARATRLIRPPRRSFEFTHIHGITWSQVKTCPDFGAAWQGLTPLLDGVSFLAAHNARFDRSVLAACCGSHELPMPDAPFLCTVKHHDAASDAEACAQIIITVRRQGKESLLLSDRRNPPSRGRRPRARRDRRA